MKTDDLIKALAADAPSVEPPIARTLAVAVAIGALLSLGYFLWAFGAASGFFGGRDDIQAASFSSSC